MELEKTPRKSRGRKKASTEDWLEPEPKIDRRRKEYWDSIKRARLDAVPEVDSGVGGWTDRVLPLKNLRRRSTRKQVKQKQVKQSLCRVTFPRRWVAGLMRDHGVCL